MPWGASTILQASERFSEVSMGTSWAPLLRFTGLNNAMGCFVSTWIFRSHGIFCINLQNLLTSSPVSLFPHAGLHYIDHLRYR